MRKESLSLRSRREWLKTAGALGLGAAASTVAMSTAVGEVDAVAVVTAQPRVLTINHDPQFFVDDYLVDNRWGIEVRSVPVRRIFHPPKKDERNPIIMEDGFNGYYLNVVRDDRAGLYRMVYQEYWEISSIHPIKYTYATAYAESTDGIHWKLPRIGKYMFKDTRDNNIVMLGPSGGAAECQVLLDLPEEERHGYQYVMGYGTLGASGIHLIGSQDGIVWDPASDVPITPPNYNPDHPNSIVWDPQRRKFVWFTRATNIYSGGDSGPRRRVARLEHSKLWEKWPVFPENILIPDELDEKSGHYYFYGMPTRYHAGIYWGFLWPYAMGLKEDIYTELAFSRDGRSFQRFSERLRLIDLGTGNAWDRGMVLGLARWVEVGDEWWFYYSGTAGVHDAIDKDRKPGVGLARLRKEGFVSLRSPDVGGAVVTHPLRWSGGKLYVNADAGQGELTVRVTGYDRKPIANFDPQLSLPVVGNSIRHEVKWKDGDISDLKGQAIRLEFFMKNIVDLYTFRAVPRGERP